MRGLLKSPIFWLAQVGVSLAVGLLLLSADLYLPMFLTFLLALQAFLISMVLTEPEHRDRRDLPPFHNYNDGWRWPW